MLNVTIATNITTTGSGTPTVSDICPDILSIMYRILPLRLWSAESKLKAESSSLI